MANEKVSNLPQKGVLSATDDFYVVDNETAASSKKAQTTSININLERTTAEIAAAVTPIYLRYIPGDVRRYAANTSPCVTDMTRALNAAISSNKIVTLPNQVHAVSSVLNITNSSVKIQGAGNGSTIRALSPNFHLFDVKTSDVQFESLVFEGAASNETTDQYAIFTDSATPATGLRVINCIFGGSSASARLNNGIKFDDNCDKGYVAGCTFDEMQGTTSGHGYGVLTGVVDDLQIIGNKAFAVTGRGRHAFYLTSGAKYCQVIGNETHGFNLAHITLSASSTQADQIGNMIANNVCEGGQTETTDGIISIFGRGISNSIIGNIVTGSGEMGILINARLAGIDTVLSDTLIANNIVRKSGTRGIEVLGTARTSLIGNKVDDSSQDAVGVSANIRLKTTDGQACTDCTIVGNVVTGTVNPRSAVTLDPTLPVPVNTKIRGNAFDAGATAVIEDNGVAYDGTKGGSGTILSGTTSINITHGLPFTPVGNQITVTLAEDPTNTPGAIFITAFNATTFSVQCENDPGASNLDFYWRYHPAVE